MLVKEKTRNIGISLQESLIQRLDKVCGYGLRSYGIQLALKDWLKTQETQEKKEVKE